MKDYKRNEFGQIVEKLNDWYYPAVEQLMYQEKDDWNDAKKGYIEETALTASIPNEHDNKMKAWDIQSYNFMNGEKAPKTVHPYLWRMEQLNNINGLFKVCDTVYQIRSFDLSTMSIVKSKNGWMVIDPLCGSENARAGWKIFKEKVDLNANLVSIFITHSHVDHYKGALELIQSEGKKLLAPALQEKFKDYAYEPAYVPIIAPHGFYDESVSENLYLGNCMSRRAVYMYGSALPRSEYGHVGAGLGKTVGSTTGNIPVPSVEIYPEEEGLAHLKVDEVKVTLQDVPGTEAPAEMHIYFPDMKVLCPGENVTHTMHNLLTPRGAKVRDPKAFGKAIDDAMRLFPDTEIIIGTHHWPVWGNAKCMEIMEKQRDMYYFFNNQVIHLLNKGMNMEEIASVFQLPDSLNREYYNRGYYGTTNHNVKAVAQRYIGWWDGNPANYFKYTDSETAERFVEDMGGAKEVLDKAKKRFEEGDYRWTMELTKQIVFDQSGKSDKETQLEAKRLEADAMEQLGYSFEGGTWRNIFLSGAFELRGKKLGAEVDKQKLVDQLKATLNTLPIEYMFEYLTTLIDGFEAAKSEGFAATIHFTDVPSSIYYIWLKNGVFHYQLNKDVIGQNIVSFKNQADFIQELCSYLKNKTDNYALKEIFKYIDLTTNDWNIIEPLEK